MSLESEAGLSLRSNKSSYTEGHEGNARRFTEKGDRESSILSTACAVASSERFQLGLFGFTKLDFVLVFFACENNMNET